MGQTGFRKELFGFHKADVVRYIDVMQQRNLEAQTALEARIGQMKGEQDSLRAQLEQTNAQNAALQTQLAALEAKQEETEALSLHIGKLYLMAHTNAQAILDHAVDASSLANGEVARNLNGIEQAQDHLRQIGAQAQDAMRRFTQTVDALSDSLSGVKSQLQQTAADTQSRAVSVEQLLSLMDRQMIQVKDGTP